MADMDVTRDATLAPPRRYNKRLTRVFHCEGCETQIATKRDDQRFCSADCHNLYQQRVLPACEECGQKFKACPRSSLMIAEGRWQRFCSRKCQGQARSRNATSRHGRQQLVSALMSPQQRLVTLLRSRRSCLTCENAFLPSRTDQLYCKERTCQLARIRERSNADSLARQLSRPERVCARCLKPFAPIAQRRSYCSKHCGRRANKENTRSHQDRARRFGVAREAINRLAVFRRDGWRCQICGIKTPQRLLGGKTDCAPELDHQVPLSGGGGHIYENVQCACRQCNSAKGAGRPVGQLDLFPVPPGVQRSYILRCTP